MEPLPWQTTSPLLQSCSSLAPNLSIPAEPCKLQPTTAAITRAAVALLLASCLAHVFDGPGYHCLSQTANDIPCIKHHEPFSFPSSSKSARIFFCRWGGGLGILLISLLHRRATSSSDPTAIICPPLQLSDLPVSVQATSENCDTGVCKYILLILLILLFNRTMGYSGSAGTAALETLDATS